MRYILMYFGSVDRPSWERLKDRPDVEVYRLDGPDFEDQVDMALLNDLILPLKLAFVGGETHLAGPGVRVRPARPKLEEAHTNEEEATRPSPRQTEGRIPK
jgi:hypothetical protein